jgi:hypothetical protein
MLRLTYVLAASAWLAFTAAGCTAQPGIATIDGPEARDLVDKLKGYIITDDTGDITVISLPKKESHVAYRPKRTADGMGPTIHALSGPDLEGRIAYVEDYFFVNTEKEKRHLLKTVRVDGTAPSEVFSRPGSAMWATTAAGSGEIGSHLALAPTSGRVAFISHVADRQMPRALLNLGHIEIWDLADKTGHDTNVIALDEPMSWFPDGERLAYSTLVKREELPQNAGGLKEFRSYFGEVWAEIPAIYIYDVKAKKSTFFYVGWQPVVSNDGQMVLVGGWAADDFIWKRVNATTGQASPVTLPGAAGPILGIASDGLILYVGLPTKGTEVKLTKNNSPLRGPKEMLSIKVSNDKGDKLQTIVPYIDPRSGASFGSAK